MCGIAGIISPYSSFVQHGRLKLMADALKHRGPEGEGYWTNAEQTVGLAHRRLRILDLSEQAAQPFHYLHYTIIFNGEIYNYIELKDELKQKGYNFTTACDTEVIPAAYDHWGTDCLNHFDGMFAFAMYDRRKEEVFIAKDRFGEKPFYYHAEYVHRARFENFIFASEMKALWATGLPKKLNGTLMLNFISLGYVQNADKKTETFFSNILSLPPGHYLTVQPSQGRVQMKKWYRLENSKNKFEIPKAGEENALIERFSELFITSVNRRLRSDVNIGTSLSGGVDSSAVVAAIKQIKQQDHLPATWSNVAFSAIFPGFEKDESVQSKIVAEHLNIKQHTIEPTAADCINKFDKLMYYHEEPVQSSSVLTQFMVYGLAKEHGITVLLDGQGADETLAGYKRYAHWYLQQLLRENIKCFRTEKKLLQQNHFLELWNWKNYVAAFVPQITSKKLEDRAYKKQMHTPFLSYDFFLHNFNKDSLHKPVVKTLDDILYYNTFHFGLPELLRYADRNSMAHAREIRLPFLGHELVEFVFSLPADLKIKKGFTKWILRKAIQTWLPAEIAWRKDKTAYEPPQKKWLQDRAIKEMIIESRKELIKRGVLLKKVLDQPVQPKGAHDDHNFDWRYLSAAYLFR
jgi:asparagine synthase (glutamine-hydrolysing)